jgi:hypothetical protein
MGDPLASGGEFGAHSPNTWTAIEMLVVVLGDRDQLVVAALAGGVSVAVSLSRPSSPIPQCHFVKPVLRATKAIARPSSMTKLAALPLYSAVKLRRVDPMNSSLRVRELTTYSECPPERERSTTYPTAVQTSLLRTHRTRRHGHP